MFKKKIKIEIASRKPQSEDTFMSERPKDSSEIFNEIEETSDVWSGDSFDYKRKQQKIPKLRDISDLDKLIKNHCREDDEII